MSDAVPRGSRIFISYRREDSSGHVLALLPALRRRFGADQIFYDTDNIPPGADFVKFIQRELQSCAVLLAIIGRDWLTIQDPRLKRRRIENTDDFLRVEVGTALHDERIRVIPVLVERGTMPSVDDLPADLAPLAFRNAVELSDSRWDSDVERLVQAIQAATTAAPSVLPRPLRPEIAELQRRRARDIADHLAAGQEALASQDCDAALSAFEKVLLLDPGHRDALELLDRVQKRVSEQKIADWLSEARARLKRGEIGEASDLIDQALAVDDTSEPGLALRKEMLTIRRERERERDKAKAVRAAIERARSSFEDGNLEAAIHYADDALTADAEAGDARAIRTKAVAAAREKRAQAEHRRAAHKVVAAARTAAEEGNLSGAAEMLREFSPAHELVTEALGALQRQLEETDGRRRRIGELIDRARVASDGDRMDESIALLSDADQLQSGRADIAALLSAAHDKKAALQHLGDAQRHFTESRFETALELCELALRLDPQNRRILDLQGAAHRAVEDRQVNGWLRDARRHVANDTLSTAAALVEQSLRVRPESSEARQLQRAIAERQRKQGEMRKRAQSARSAIDRARVNLTNQAFDAVISAADEALESDPGNLEALHLKNQAESALSERQRAVDAAADARRLAAEGGHEDALKALRAFTPRVAIIEQAENEIADALQVLRRRPNEEVRQAEEHLRPEQAHQAKEHRRAQQIRRRRHGESPVPEQEQQRAAIEIANAVQPDRSASENQSPTSATAVQPQRVNAEQLPGDIVTARETVTVDPLLHADWQSTSDLGWRIPHLRVAWLVAGAILVTLITIWPRLKSAPETVSPPSSVAVNAVPWANVRIVPPDRTGGVLERTTPFSISLSEGTYQFEFQHPAYGKTTQTVTIGSGGNPSVAQIMPGADVDRIVADVLGDR